MQPHPMFTVMVPTGILFLVLWIVSIFVPTFSGWEALALSYVFMLALIFVVSIRLNLAYAKHQRDTND